jgi:tricorn protease
MRYPAISPDGQSILFRYEGDIYSVPSKGGLAVPLTISEWYEFSPVWSHDGRWIAFGAEGNGFVEPDVVSGGRDQQIEAAVKELMKKD